MSLATVHSTSCEVLSYNELKSCRKKAVTDMLQCCISVQHYHCSSRLSVAQPSTSLLLLKITLLYSVFVTLSVNRLTPEYAAKML